SKFYRKLSAERPRTHSRALFPYTTLFRSGAEQHGGARGSRGAGEGARAHPPGPGTRAAALLRSEDRARDLILGGGLDGQIASSRSEEHTSELQSQLKLLFPALLERIR